MQFNYNFQAFKDLFIGKKFISGSDDSTTAKFSLLEDEHSQYISHVWFNVNPQYVIVNVSHQQFFFYPNIGEDTKLLAIHQTGKVTEDLIFVTLSFESQKIKSVLTGMEIDTVELKIDFLIRRSHFEKRFGYIRQGELTEANINSIMGSLMRDITFFNHTRPRE